VNSKSENKFDRITPLDYNCNPSLFNDRNRTIENPGGTSAVVF